MASSQRAPPNLAGPDPHPDSGYKGITDTLNLPDAEDAVALLVDKAVDSLWMVWIKWGGAGTRHTARW
jgi:hypothetical protein